ncbi:hypothetical protein BGW80DRAFT_1288584 [Lactifluus volemus]|nr:hypothetical protein BGW80DRAFT_1288584 [Lactifluus volemus]
MPLASSGLLSSTTRQAFRASIHSPPNISSTRSLHTPSFAPRTIQQPSSFASRALHRSRNIINAFIGHLTTPGTLRGQVPASRSIQSAASRMPTIETNLSLPVRRALSMPMGAPRLPRPPAVPRSVAQVGLGTARNFTTGRPIFQSIADKIYNVPVTSRAFLQADLDMRTKDASAFKHKRAAHEEKERTKRHRRARTSKVEFHPVATTRTTAEPVVQATEFDKYFAPAQVPDVSTTLLVPLAPTPTTRMPLAHMFTYDRHPLIPFVELSQLHIDAERHASRVKTLFDQLDTAQVWDKGATCETFGGARGAGVLRVRFSGWSPYAVRGILGESATGWCILEEERTGTKEEDLNAAMSDTDMDMGLASAADRSGLAELNLNSPIDPTYSFVLPTLDFSASADHAPSASVAAPLFSDPTSNVSSSDDFEMISDSGSIGLSGSRSSSPGWIEPPDALHSSRSPSWVGLSFSSAFCHRLEEGPQEEVF